MAALFRTSEAAWQDDRALVRRLKRGDARAFEEFVQDHVPRLHRFALARLRGDASAAQDVVQTTVCKALDKLEQYRGTAALFTWLCSICHNEVVTWQRTKGRVVEIPWTEADPDINRAPDRTDSRDPADILVRKEAAQLVHLALDRLPRNHARALQWKYLDGLSVQAIAERLGTTAKAAESILSRARVGFRDAHAGVVKGLDGRGFRGLRDTDPRDTDLRDTDLRDTDLRDTD